MWRAACECGAQEWINSFGFTHRFLFMDMLLHYFDNIFGPRNDIAVASSDCYLTCLVGTRQCRMWTTLRSGLK